MTTPKVETELMDRMRPGLFTLVTEDAKRLQGLQYCDLRMSIKEEKGSVAENGNEKASSEDYTFDFGVRVISGGRTRAPGYFGQVLGSSRCSPHRAGGMGRYTRSSPPRPGQRATQKCRTTPSGECWARA